MSADNRKFKRLATNWNVKIRAVKYTDTAVRRMQEKIKNISTGGLFIETSVPMDIGTHVEFQFQIPGRADEIHAKGLVRWSNDGRIGGMPVGMGIEFLEVATTGQQAIESYVLSQTASAMLEPLLKTDLRRNLLRLYCRKIGEKYTVDLLVQFLACKPVELLEAVRDLVNFRLATFTSDTITFVSAESNDLNEALTRWYQSTPGGGTPDRPQPAP